MGNVTAMRAPAAVGDYLSPAQVCELVPGMTERGLKELRVSGKGPEYFKPTGTHGRVTLYSRAAVIAWVEKSRVVPKGSES